MTPACTGCTHACRRIKWSVPRLYCAKYKRVTDARCIDYQTRRSAIDVALEYFKRSSIK